MPPKAHDFAMERRLRELDPALQEGDWRELTADEVRLLREAAGLSE